MLEMAGNGTADPQRFGDDERHRRIDRDGSPRRPTRPVARSANMVSADRTAVNCCSATDRRPANSAAAFSMLARAECGQRLQQLSAGQRQPAKAVATETGWTSRDTRSSMPRSGAPQRHPAGWSERQQVGPGCGRPASRQGGPVCHGAHSTRSPWLSHTRPGGAGAGGGVAGRGWAALLALWGE